FSASHPGIRTLQAIIFVNLFGYCTVAYLAGLLSDKLRQTDKRLAYFRGALENLQALHETSFIRPATGSLPPASTDALLWSIPRPRSFCKGRRSNCLASPFRRCLRTRFQPEAMKTRIVKCALSRPRIFARPSAFWFPS